MIYGVSVVVNNMLEKQLKTFGINGLTIGTLLESMFVRKIVYKSICLSILTA